MRSITDTRPRLEPVTMAGRIFGHGAQFAMHRMAEKDRTNKATYAHLPPTPCSAKDVRRAMHAFTDMKLAATHEEAAKPKRVRKTVKKAPIE